MGKSWSMYYHVMCTMAAMRTYERETDRMDDKAKTEKEMASPPTYDKKKNLLQGTFLTDVHCHVLDGPVSAPLHDAPNLRSGNVV